MPSFIVLTLSNQVTINPTVMGDVGTTNIEVTLDDGFNIVSYGFKVIVTN